MINSNKEILATLIKIERELDRHNRYIDSFCGSINDLIERVKKLENLENIEQATTKSNQVKDNTPTGEKLENAVSRLIADIQNELNDGSISPNKERSFPSIYDSEPGNVVLSTGVYPVHLKGVYENHDYTVIVGLALNNRTRLDSKAAQQIVKLLAQQQNQD